MYAQEQLVEVKVLNHLVQDIGFNNTRKFMESMVEESQKRIHTLRQAQQDRSFTLLASEAQTLKNLAQVCGAYKLADILQKLEVESSRENEEAFTLAKNALCLADLTQFAYLEIELAV